jgi:hypothetical protein
MKKIKKSTLLELELIQICFNKNKLLRIRASEVFKIKHKIPKFTRTKICEICENLCQKRNEAKFRDLDPKRL